MNSKKQWTKDQCSNLIEMYRQHTNLWDSKSMDYKNKNKRQDSLKEIGNTFETSSDEIDRKIKNLVSQYNRERRKYKSMKKSGAGHSFISKWFRYDAMSFLYDKNKPRKGREGGLNLNTQDSDSSSGSSLNDTQSPTYDENLDEESNGNLPEMPSPISEEQSSLCDGQADIGKRDNSFTVPKAIIKKTKPTATSIRQEAFNMMKSVYDSRKTTRDDYEVFGELVSRKLRSLKTMYAKATVQHLINNILYDAEIGKYDEPTTIYYAGTSTSSSYGSPLPLSIQCNNSNSETSMNEEQVNNNINTSGCQERVPQQIREDLLGWTATTSFGINPENE